jgi:NAD(P)-dependent dehydrogenase (short-subunit alcohol dehydrogenase family)
MVRVALITGASRGIAAATALVLAERGCRVVVNPILHRLATTFFKSFTIIGPP